MHPSEKWSLLINDDLSLSAHIFRTDQELGVLKGQLSRWLLPFNTDTSVEEQQAATPRRFQESLMASSATSGATGGGSGGVLTEEEAEYLTAGARRVRQLVRGGAFVFCLWAWEAFSLQTT